MKRFFRTIIYAIPGTQAIWVRLHTAISGEGRPEFKGWGMISSAVPPWWNGGGDVLATEFVATASDVGQRVADGLFELSMFDGLQNPERQLPKQLGELMWRHYFVYWSVRYAINATKANPIHLVECGVCDGLTAYFALSAATAIGRCKAFLYDAWEAIRADALTESDKGLAGQYSYLSIENTRRNLAPFADQSVLIKGFIPDSFNGGHDPSSVTWLHVDLNSSAATIAVLGRFFDLVVPGGVILFDDYGWRRYYATKVAVDEFLATKQGTLLPLPTGQAIFFKC
jgi:hypothetical protein